MYTYKHSVFISSVTIMCKMIMLECKTSNLPKSSRLAINILSSKSRTVFITIVVIRIYLFSSL